MDVDEFNRNVMTFDDIFTEYYIKYYLNDNDDLTKS